MSNRPIRSMTLRAYNSDGREIAATTIPEPYKTSPSEAVSWFIDVVERDLGYNPAATRVSRVVVDIAV